MSLILIISLQTNKILWVNAFTGCDALNALVDAIPSLKVNDTLFIIGFCSEYMTGLMMAIDSNLNAKWIIKMDTLDIFPPIKGIVKLDDSLIATIPPLGIFNIKTRSYVWLKSSYYPLGSLAFDGSNLMAGLEYYYSSPSSIILKVDLNGTILWAKKISLQAPYLLNFTVKDIIFDGQNYVLLIITTFANPDPYGDDWRLTTILKLDTAGNLIWIKSYNVGNNFFKLLKDSDGYVALGFLCAIAWYCSNLDNDNILLLKIDFDGNVKFLKSYSSNVSGWISEDRAYNITFDYDGNYLISGLIIASSNSSYPIVLKVDRENGNLIWARVWNTPPPNTTSNEARGIISIGQGKFYLLTFLGGFGGFAVIREDTASPIQCTQNINFNVSSLGTSIDNFTPQVYSVILEEDSFRFPLSYIYTSAFLTEGCSISSNYEFNKSCLFKVSSNKGYIHIELNKREKVSIYDISGKAIYNEFFEGKRKIKVKEGVYVVKIGKENVKVVVK
jgi:hypothetical protein